MSTPPKGPPLSETEQAMANVDKRKEEIARQEKIKSQSPPKKRDKRRESSQKAIGKAREKARKGSPAEHEKYQVILENHKKKDLLTSRRRVPGSFGQGKRR